MDGTVQPTRSSTTVLAYPPTCNTCVSAVYHWYTTADRILVRRIYHAHSGVIMLMDYNNLRSTCAGTIVILSIYETPVDRMCITVYSTRILLVEPNGITFCEKNE